MKLFLRLFPQESTHLEHYIPTIGRLSKMNKHTTEGTLGTCIVQYFITIDAATSDNKKLGKILQIRYGRKSRGSSYPITFIFESFELNHTLSF